MNHIKPIALLVEEKRIVDALAQVRPLMASWDEIEPFRTLVRLFDYALMYRHSGLVARYAHRKFNTLQTLAWLCDEWLDQRRPLDVEEALTPRLTAALEGRVEEPRESAIARAAFALVHALLDMQRIDVSLDYRHNE